MIKSFRWLQTHTEAVVRAQEDLVCAEARASGSAPAGSLEDELADWPVLFASS